MKTSELLRTFLVIAPEAHMQSLPVYFTTFEGELQPLRGCSLLPGVEGGDIGDFEPGPVSVIYDRRSYRAKGPPASLKDLWAALLGFKRPGQQVAIAVFTGDGADVLNISAVSLVSGPQGDSFIRIDPVYWTIFD